MPEISDAKIAILATDGFEKSELFEPKRQLQEAGATVVVVAARGGHDQELGRDRLGRSGGG